MSKPPKDTHGPVVETGPTRGQNRSRNKDGRWRAKRSDAGHERNGTTPPEPPKANLSLWFWGTIGVLFAVVLALGITAYVKSGADEPPEPTAAPSTETTEEEASAALDPDAIRAALDPAVRIALDAVDRRMDVLVDTAFEPVYAAIPEYADFHFSIAGEYTELAAAAMGDAEAQIAAMLYAGLEERLSASTSELQALFVRRLEEGLDSNLAELKEGGADFAELKTAILESAKQRIVFTLPVNVAAVAGTKVAASAVAKAITTKLAVKAAAKTGGKLAATAAGAGTGAVLCSWAGPGAAVCGVVGGAAVWFGTDQVIVQISEYWTRDEFEADLNKLVDEQKAAVKVAFRAASLEAARKVGNEKEQIIQEFTLEEFYNPRNCAAARDLIALYDPLRENLRERTPAALDALRAAIAPLRDDPVVSTYANQIENNLAQMGPVTITALVIRGNLPPDDRDDNTLTGWIDLNAQRFDLGEVSPTAETGFKIALALDLTVEITAPIRYALVLEQDNLPIPFRGNSFFGSAATVDLLAKAEITAGLAPQATLPAFIARDKDAGSTEAVKVFPISGEPLTLTFSLQATPLDPVPLDSRCSD